MNILSAEYTKRFNLVLKPTSEALEEFLYPLFTGQAGVCRVSTRPKTITSFLEKAQRTHNGRPKYSDPMNQIQDQIGALVLTRFSSDIPPIAEIVEKHFRRIERSLVEPDSESEFGYVGRHYILFIPNDARCDAVPDSDLDFFELQIKTLFQYAWSETNHSIGYKRLESLSPEQRRLSAYVAAQAWGADRAVCELYEEVSKGTENEVNHA